MAEVKTEIKQIRNQILVGIKEDKIDFTWGKMIIDTCNKALTLYGVVDKLVCDNHKPMITSDWRGLRCDNCGKFEKPKAN